MDQQERIKHEKSVSQRIRKDISVSTIHHKGRGLNMAIFGPTDIEYENPYRDSDGPEIVMKTYRDNIEAMKKTYSHPVTGEQITFRPATTSEFFSALAQGLCFNGLTDTKEYRDLRGLQIGHIVKTREGVFTNTTITDENQLKQLLDSAEEVNGIYLLDNEIAFAPYESFWGWGNIDRFVEEGLARALEHTTEDRARNLRDIVSTKFYNKGVKTVGFEEVDKPTLIVASLTQKGSVSDDRVVIIGEEGYWSHFFEGYAFGVMKLKDDVKGGKLVVGKG